jgi:hypothetical protein
LIGYFFVDWISPVLHMRHVMWRILDATPAVQIAKSGLARNLSDCDSTLIRDLQFCTHNLSASGCVAPGTQAAKAKVVSRCCVEALADKRERAFPKSRKVLSLRKHSSSLFNTNLLPPPSTTPTSLLESIIVSSCSLFNCNIQIDTHKQRNLPSLPRRRPRHP